MHLCRRPLIVIAALFALMGAQVFGLQRGYVCDCGGMVELTEFDHCHGPHSAACHDEESPVEHHSHGHADDECGGDTHHHAPYVESIEFFKQQNGGFAPPSLAGVLSAVPLILSLPLAEPPEVVVRITPHNDRSPPECLRVARTQVMLI
jgi:hypothetical protein